MIEPLQDLQSLQGIDLAELNLDPATRELVQRLLNCIETLVADLNEAQAEILRGFTGISGSGDTRRLRAGA